jgi:AraC-like DNA-binding protein
MSHARFQASFLRRIGDFQTFQQLLELLPDVAFFMKDRQGRFVMQNRRACEYCRVGSEAETLGKTDYDFWSPQLAGLYVAQDRKVMKTGEPIINALTLAPEDIGSDHLVIYSKVPVRDRRQRIIGIAGIHREVEGLRTPPRQFGQLSKAVERMHRDFAEPLTTPKLAAIAGLSRSQFERVFHRLFGASPREYLLRLRVNAASRLLTDTDRKCTDIALATGFYDHSHFSRVFQRIMGISPQHYRRRHAPAESGCTYQTPH